VSRPMRNRGLIHVLIWMTLWLALPKAACGQQTNSPAQDSACSTGSLPDGLRKKLAAQFASWKIQELHDLSPSGAVRWSSADYTGCPGIAAGEFRERHRQSDAVLLVPREKPDSAYRLVIYSASTGTAEEEFNVAEKRDVAGAANFFLNTAHLDELFDVEARRKSHMSAKDAVLLFDAGETEYEVDAYYWAETAYRSSPADI
jgi:hypothetical protein